MPRSLQILRARTSAISEWRGTGTVAPHALFEIAALHRSSGVWFRCSHLQRLANHLFAGCARLALGILATHLKEQPNRVFDHLAGLLEGAALAVCARDLRHRDHPPAVLGVLVDSGQLLHALSPLFGPLRPAPPDLRPVLWPACVSYSCTPACPARCGGWCFCAPQILRSGQIWT